MRRPFSLLILALVVIAAAMTSRRGRGAVLSPHAVDAAHAACYSQASFPSARMCRECHPNHYREWSVSPHAYAQISPIFNAMSNRLNVLTNGTMGDFCIRCHTPVGMARGEPLNISNLQRHPTSREGVTCAVCHRVNQAWGKMSGRQSLRSGEIHEPVSGPTGPANLRAALANPDRYGPLKTQSDPGRRGRDVHRSVVPFFQMTTSGFCASCHDVLGPNGFHLEDAFSEYKKSPAARKEHYSCQDCHMGVEPGVPAGYRCEPVARVGNATTPPRRRTNHMFVGPDYSVVHPGLFPHNPELIRETHPDFDERPGSNQGPLPGMATMGEWLQFDYQKGWGTRAFEQSLNREQEEQFPTPWQDAERRYRARDLLDRQFELLSEASAGRKRLLQHGYKLHRLTVERVDRRGVWFGANVSNGTTGHGVPTGFDADRLVFLRAQVWGPDGERVFASGDLDPNGDVRDSHSRYVHNGLLPLDRQLFSLQSRFVIRMLRGGEREQILTPSLSLDPLPFLRPEARPTTALGRPLAARKHKQNVEVGGSRRARYQVKAAKLCSNGQYVVQVQLIAGMVPVNLVHEVSPSGFDYAMSARQVAEALVAGHQVIHERTTTFQWRR